MKKGLIVLSVLLVGVWFVSSQAGAVTLVAGDFGMKFSDISYNDINTESVPYLPDGTPNPGYDPTSVRFAPGQLVDPDGPGPLPGLPGQEPPPGWVGTGNLWGIATVSSIHTLIAGNLESPVLNPTPYWTAGTNGEWLQAVYGGLTLSRTVDGLGSPATSFPYDQFYVDDPTTVEAAYLKVYLLDHDAFTNDLAAGPNQAGGGAFGTFGADITSGTLWLDMVIAPGVLWADGALVPVGVQPGDLEHVKNTSLTAGSGTLYTTIVGGSAFDEFLTGQFPLFPSNPAWFGDPQYADIKFISDLTSLFDIAAPWGQKYLDVNGWWINSQDPVTGTYIPEPASMLLLGFGLLGAGGVARRRMK